MIITYVCLDLFHLTVALHKDYPLVCRWFISLARRDHFTSAVWKASNDVGFDAFRDFIKGSKKPASLPADGDARVKLQAKSKAQSTKVSKLGAGRKLNQPAQKKEQAAETHVRMSLSLSLSLSLSPLFPTLSN